MLNMNPLQHATPFYVFRGQDGLVTLVSTDHEYTLMVVPAAHPMAAASEALLTLEDGRKVIGLCWDTEKPQIDETTLEDIECVLSP